MNQVKLEQNFAKIDDLPSLSTTANNVIRITQNPKSSAGDVGKAISHDQSLTTKVLKTANSSYFGFPKKISTITHAIVILGFAHIKNIVLTTSIMDMFPSKGKNEVFDRHEFWKHSLACAITADLIARRLGMQNLEEIFICGMLHDIGKIVLDTYLNDEFTNAVKLANEKGILLKNAETQIMSLDHSLVGGFVAEKWNLTPTLTKAIKFHHNPSFANESMRIVAIVHVADVLCRTIGIGNGGDRKVPRIDEESWKLLEFNKQALKRLFLEMEQQVSIADDFIPTE